MRPRHSQTLSTPSCLTARRARSCEPCWVEAQTTPSSIAMQSWTEMSQHKRWKVTSRPRSLGRSSGRRWHHRQRLLHTQHHPAPRGGLGRRHHRQRRQPCQIWSDKSWPSFVWTVTPQQLRLAVSPKATVLGARVHGPQASAPPVSDKESRTKILLQP